MTTSDEREPDGAAVFQIEEIELDDIGRQLIDLADDLRAAGDRLKGRRLLDLDAAYVGAHGEDIEDHVIAGENTETRAAFRATLNAMRRFRREYDRWERLAAEYALTHMHYSQREAAQELGVATSTINRWAQHPLKIEDYR